MKKPAFGHDTFCLEAMNFEPGPIKRKIKEA
jgi:hypothetical protein